MLCKYISESVLTVGNRSDKPDGGIAQVLYSYRNNVFPIFKSIVNFKRGTFLFKLWVMIVAYVKMFIVLLFDRKIKIVHIHTASDNGFKRNIFFVNLASFFGKKIILHIHSGRFNDYYIKNKEEVSRVFSKCTCVIALTHKIREFYQEMGCDKVQVIDNIIEYPQIHVNRKSQIIHCLYLGVITRTKGIYDLLDAILQNQALFRNRLVLHIGGNKEVDTLLDKIRENKLEDIVKFEGWVSGKQKIDLLNLCDVFILPSYTEGLPISILEAQSYGLFTVATNVGGIPEIVDNSNGILFEPGDTDTLSTILSTIVQEVSILDNKEAIKKASSRYLPSSISSQLETLYSKILSNKGLNNE